VNLGLAAVLSITTMRSDCFNRRAFTLTEMLIVVFIFVVLLGLGVAGWQGLIRSSAVDSAQNVAGAYLGRAREEAMGLRVPRGVIFFESGDRLAMTMVYHDNPGSLPGQIEQVPGVETQNLPAGVGARFPNTSSPRYTLPGVMLFDGFGQLYVRDYQVNPNGKLGALLGVSQPLSGYSHVGATIFPSSKYEQQPHADRDHWLDEHGRALFPNRYSGTLSRGRQ
jgi:prepilin-type N-terminal cleavage/methylation domain-containing protein